jgi:hypothetical protein
VEPVCGFGIALLVLELLLSPAGLVVIAIVLLELMSGVRELRKGSVWGRDLIVICEMYALLRWHEC